MNNLREKALLVTLNVHQWTARKFDRKVTDEVNKNHNATDAGRFNKLLISKAHLDPIQKIVNEARNFHYDNTIVWGDLGERLLPSLNYFEYMKGLAEIKSRFESAVATFCKEYDAMRIEAQARLNGLFNEKDYPKDIEDRFAFKTTFMPIPETTDFRIDINQGEIDKIKEHIEGELSDRFAQAQRSIYQRIKDQLGHMHDRLSEKDNVFKNSLFDNLKDLIDLLPRLNVTGDPMISAMCEGMKELVADPDAVRKDERLRTEKANKASAMLKNLDAIFGAPKSNPVEV